MNKAKVMQKAEAGEGLTVAEIKVYQKTVTQIIMGLLNNGFELKVVEEAEPPKEMMDIPGMEDELRRPMMLLVKAIAKK